jgi:hypothetical protein
VNLVKCPYDCGKDIEPGQSHGCRNTLRKQRDALTRRVAELESCHANYVEMVRASAKDNSDAWAESSALTRRVAELEEVLRTIASGDRGMAEVEIAVLALAASQSTRKETCAMYLQAYAAGKREGIEAAAKVLDAVPEPKGPTPYTSLELTDLPPCITICSECGVDRDKLDDIAKRRWWWTRGYGCAVCKPGPPPPIPSDQAETGEGKR